MRVLLAILISLLPLSVFADMPTANQPTIVVVPDGHGGVQYRRMPHGLDPLTALTIGDGLSQIGRRHREPTPSLSPPLTAPEFHYNRQADPVGDANKLFLDYLNHR